VNDNDDQAPYKVETPSEVIGRQLREAHASLATTPPLETPAQVIEAKASTLRVVDLATKRADSKAGMLATLDDLRSRIESGELVAWCGVGICGNDETLRWQATVGKVTNLRLIGAVASLAHYVHEDL
jgi:hypothetical protein